MGIKEVIVKIIPAVFQPFFWLGKLLLYRPFVHLYYLIFRVKKYDIGNQSKMELIRKKSFHVTALIFIVFAISLNITDKKQASAAVGKQKRSVMAEVVKNEFSLVGQDNDELIQETAIGFTPQTSEKYFTRRPAVTAPKGITPQTEDTDTSVIARNGNMITNPKQIIPGAGEVDDTPVKRTEIINYAVLPGDTISTIARRFEINVNTVLWANNLTAFSIIRAGDSLKILPSDGFLYTVKRGDTIGRLAQNYDTTAEKIVESNNLSGAGIIAAGQQLIIPGIKRTVTAPAVVTKPVQTSYSGIDVIKDIVSSDKPIVSSNKMVWPTEGSRITQYFSWKHNGVDIGNKVGTPIYAADSGVVELSQGGYNGGYGNTIVINHGGGKKTRYGHASKLLVKKGAEVEKGQLIALMGSTGRSTGSHLHFEVIINGTRYNPLNYIK
ncbi:MAG: M23 family metallopeptidase [bacterium]|nr:M23 family metallopeptidase [bacterium]